MNTLGHLTPMQLMALTVFWKKQEELWTGKKQELLSKRCRHLRKRKIEHLRRLEFFSTCEGQSMVRSTQSTRSSQCLCWKILTTLKPVSKHEKQPHHLT